MKIRVSLHLYWLFFCLSYASFTQAQADLQQLDLYFQKALVEWQIPGMAIAIVKDGKTVLEKGYGVLEAGKAAKVDEHSLFAIASNTKAFIAAEIAMLVEQSKLHWDDPVQKYLPDFELYDSYVSQNATIRDLLCHRIGLGTFSGDVVWYKSNYTTEELIDRLKYVPQAFPFRSGWGYSNLMFITAGEVIKAVSGKSWSQFANTHIFRPLSMQRTLTSTNELRNTSNVATPHKPIDGAHRPIPWVNWDNMGAAGGIISSAHDMAEWLKLQLDGGIRGADTLFTAKSQSIMWTPHNNFRVSQASRALFPSRHFNGYGLGWSLADYGGRMMASHGGGYDGMYSRVVLVPDEKLGIVVLTNGMKGISTWLTYYVVDRYLEMEEKDWSISGLKRQREAERKDHEKLAGYSRKRITGTQPSLAYEKYLGRYESKLFGPIEVERDGKELALRFPNAPHFNARLKHWHFNTFQIIWNEVHAWFNFGTVQFILNNNAEVQELQFDVPNHDIFFEEIEAKKVK